PDRETPIRPFSTVGVCPFGAPPGRSSHLAYRSRYSALNTSAKFQLPGSDAEGGAWSAWPALTAVISDVPLLLARPSQRGPAFACGRIRRWNPSLLPLHAKPSCRFTSPRQYH